MTGKEENTMIGKGALGGAASGAMAGTSISPGWGTLIGAVVGTVGGLIGGSAAARKRRKMDEYLSRQQTEATSWYNANALGDYMQRADTQSLMKNVRDNLYRNSRTAAGAAAITGATPEQTAARQEAINREVGNVYSRIGAMGQQWKDNITENYFRRKERYDTQRMGMMEGEAASYENVMSNGLQTGTNALSAYLNGYGNRN